MRSSLRRLAAALALAASVAVVSADDPPVAVPARNVNMVGGKAVLDLGANPPVILGDFLLKQQNEPSCTAGSLNPLHLLCGANDYRLVDLPGTDPERVTRDAWLGVFHSADGGETWNSTVHPGSFVDTAPSPLKGFAAAADPIVRSGPGGIAYFGGIAFKKEATVSGSTAGGEAAPGVIFVSTWLDLDNKEDESMPHKHARTVVVDAGTDGQFLDKIWMFVSAPQTGATCSVTAQRSDGTPVQRTVPASRVFVAYSTFTGKSNQTHSKLMVAYSDDCAATWSRPVKVSESNHINQGVSIAKLLTAQSNKVLLVWRRFSTGTGTDRDAILGSVSNDNGLTWSKASAVATPICALEQSTASTRFRIHTFPSVTASPTAFFVAWSDRGKDASGLCSPAGTSRIVLATSASGTSWSAPAIADNTPSAAHQYNPSVSYVANTLHLLWMDAREDQSGFFGPTIDEFPLLRAAAGLVPEVNLVPGAPGGVKRHTGDVWTMMGVPGIPPQWGPSARVSQYRFGVRAGSTLAQQQYNPLNLRLHGKTTKVFNGDYIDQAVALFVPPDPLAGRPMWTYNIGQLGASVVVGAWADNRDVRRAREADDGVSATPYTPPTFPGTTSIADPTQPRPVCNPAFPERTGTLNQNVYSARIGRGLFAYSRHDAKPVGGFDRAFTIVVRNDSMALQPKSYQLDIPAIYQPPGGMASFDQFAPVSSMVVSVPRLSSTSRSVFLVPDSNPSTPPVPAHHRVLVKVTELGTATPQQAYVYLNPDPTVAPLEKPGTDAPAIELEEVYTPIVEAATIRTILAPEVEAPEVEAPEVEAPEVEAPEVEAQSILALSAQAPEVEAPEVEAPEVEAPEVEASSITDITWPVTNTGNTTAVYDVRPTVVGATGAYTYQLIVSRVYLIAGATDCGPAHAVTQSVAVNIGDATALVNPATVIDPSSPLFASFSAAPGETWLVTLRVRGTTEIITPFDPTTVNTTLAITPDAVDTALKAGGATSPTSITVGAVPPSVVTEVLPSATSGVPYAAPLTVSGGVPPYTWSVESGVPPPGLSVTPNGAISGTPTTAGTFSFAVRATDSSAPTKQIALKSVTLVVNEGISLTLKLGSGTGAALSIKDNGAGDADATVGVITYIGPFGGLLNVVATAISKPSIGGANDGQVAIHAFAIAGPAGGTLSVTATDTSFPAAAGSRILTSAIGGVANGPISFQAYADAGNAPFGTTGAACTTGLQAAATGPFDATATTNCAVTGFFSVTGVAQLNPPANLNSGVSATISVKVP